MNEGKEIEYYRARLPYESEKDNIISYNWFCNAYSDYWFFNDIANRAELPYMSGCTRSTHYVYTPKSVRPVINVYKSVLETNNNNNNNNNE